MAWNRGGGGGASLAPLKTALQYADDDLGITVATSSYGEICDALEDYFPENKALIPVQSNDTYVFSSGAQSGRYDYFAFDGSDSTYWFSPTTTTTDYIGCLENEERLKRLKVHSCKFYGASQSASSTWYLQYSDGDGTWTSVGSVDVSTSYAEREIVSSEHNAHRLWRLYATTGTNNGMGVRDMQLYGTEEDITPTILFDDGVEYEPLQYYSWSLGEHDVYGVGPAGEWTSNGVRTTSTIDLTNYRWFKATVSSTQYSGTLKLDIGSLTGTYYCKLICSNLSGGNTTHIQLETNQNADITRRDAPRYVRESCGTKQQTVRCSKMWLE